MTNPCRHWWEIEQAAGPVSRGVCRKCGEVKEFINWYEDERRWTSQQGYGPGTPRRGQYPTSIGSRQEHDDWVERLAKAKRAL